MSLVFQQCRLRLWHGYYRRIPGETTAFHVPSNERSCVLPFVYWERDDGRGLCRMVESEAGYALADAVNRAKRQFGGWGGGSFLINEHGQVLVPASDGGGDVMLTGEVEGELEFEDPFHAGTIFSLADDEGLSVGDPWDGPYVGMWYNLSTYGWLYRMRSRASGQVRESPPRQDSRLVGTLRSLRGYGPVRFLVNPHGIVLIRVPPDNGTRIAYAEESWQAVSAGRIDSECWFAKEE